MKQQLRDLSDRLARTSLAGHGFTRRRGRFVKSDALLRSVWVVQLFGDRESLTFDILFDLGIPGISAFTEEGQEWIVRAHGDTVHRRSGNPQVRFRFDGNCSAELVVDAAITAVDVVCHSFLLRYSGPQELYVMVRDSALSFLRDRGAENEFQQLELEPWNVVPRLELAAVYAAFLGHEEDASRLSREAVQYAKKMGIDYAIPHVKESVMHAHEVSRIRGLRG